MKKVYETPVVVTEAVVLGVFGHYGKKNDHNNHGFGTGNGIFNPGKGSGHGNKKGRK